MNVLTEIAPWLDFRNWEKKKKKERKEEKPENRKNLH